MTRTDQRPLPQGELSAFHASCFAFVIGVLGALILYFFVNTLTMVLTLASLIGYAFIYTVYLKRATPQNIVIGGLAGAAPPLLGWASISNSIDPYALRRLPKTATNSSIWNGRAKVPFESRPSRTVIPSLWVPFSFTGNFEMITTNLRVLALTT